MEASPHSSVRSPAAEEPSLLLDDSILAAGGMDCLPSVGTVSARTRRCRTSRSAVVARVAGLPEPACAGLPEPDPDPVRSPVPGQPVSANGRERRMTVSVSTSGSNWPKPANGASIRSRRQDFELGRPGMWLRMDFEKPPSTQMSWPVT